MKYKCDTINVKIQPVRQITWGWTIPVLIEPVVFGGGGGRWVLKISLGLLFLFNRYLVAQGSALMGNNPTKPEEFVSIVAGHLDLGFRKLQELPPKLLSIRPPHLRSLDLSHNSFVSIGGIELLHQLEKLDLSHNEFGVLEVWIISLSNLEVLNISHNLISILPSGIQMMKKLKELRISHNRLEGFVELTTLTNITSIDVSFNSIAKIPDEIFRLVCISVFLFYV